MRSMQEHDQATELKILKFEMKLKLPIVLSLIDANGY